MFSLKELTACDSPLDLFLSLLPDNRFFSASRNLENHLSSFVVRDLNNERKIVILPLSLLFSLITFSLFFIALELSWSGSRRNWSLITNSRLFGPLTAVTAADALGLSFSQSSDQSYLKGSNFEKLISDKLSQKKILLPFVLIRVDGFRSLWCMSMWQHYPHLVSDYTVRSRSLVGPSFHIWESGEWIRDRSLVRHFIRVHYYRVASEKVQSNTFWKVAE